VARAVWALLSRFDVLHAHLASTLTPFAMWAAHALGRPVVCKVACGGAYFDFRSLRLASIFGAVLERSLVRSVDRWVAISHEVSNDLVRAGVPAERIVSIPNGIDPSAFHPKTSPGLVRKFVCLGRMEKFDLGTLFGAFDELLRSVGDAELRLAGHMNIPQARKTLQAYPLARARTTLCGLSRTEDELGWADAFVLPSLAEGMSNALLEAMTMGLPCIASDIAPNREVLNDGAAGLLAPLRDVRAWSAAMELLAREPSTAQMFGRAGRARIEREFTISSVADRLHALYRAIQPNASAESPRLAPKELRPSESNKDT
ncbi:MAG TPA: glycosyltransferase family 4 protein, partial [Methanomassiliicoccales archaeon]|nr:glycosyltransferase family 4 protein [Methanomassiliicoccales archaeon]